MKVEGLAWTVSSKSSGLGPNWTVIKWVKMAGVKPSRFLKLNRPVLDYRTF